MLLTATLSYGSVQHTVRMLRWVPALVAVLPWLFGPPAPTTELRIRDLSGPVSFRLLDWETVHLAERASRLWHGLVGSAEPWQADAETLRTYFAAAGQAREALRPTAEAALERVISSAYRAGGLARSEPLALPDNRLFPPVLVALTAPPNVLVISPRDQIRVLDSSVLQAIETQSQLQLEVSADSSNVSSLVAPIGGLATYPSMVLDEDSAERVLSSVAHEWLHQYLIFYPLGREYWTSQQTREINETTADMVGQEVGAALASQLGVSASPGTPPQAASAFDFRAFMRETRSETERLLAAGEIDVAEAYMEQRRDLVNQHGYRIRKINQAYFALYGSYGDGFAASPTNPIPGLLHSLRDRSLTLGDFIVRMRTITTIADLQRAAAG